MYPWATMHDCEAASPLHSHRSQAIEDGSEARRGEVDEGADLRGDETRLRMDEVDGHRRRRGVVEHRDESGPAGMIAIAALIGGMTLLPIGLRLLWSQYGR
jgi:hypothetical protein